MKRFFASHKVLWVVIAVFSVIIVTDDRFFYKKTLTGFIDGPTLVYNSDDISGRTLTADTSSYIKATSSDVLANLRTQNTPEQSKAVVFLNSTSVPTPIVKIPPKTPVPRIDQATQIRSDLTVSLQGDTRTCDQVITANPFYRDKYLQALSEQKRLYQEGKNSEADMLKEIACFPSGIWITESDMNTSVRRVADVLSLSSREGKIPVFVLYSQPDHNSARWWNGLKGESYTKFVRGIAEAIGTSTAWVIVEPDAIGLSVNYSSQEREYRLNELRQVVLIFKQYSPKTRVYLDAGHSNWKSATSNAELLKKAGIGDADGFVTNVSNYQFLMDEVVYGSKLSRLVGNKPFIVDTARNGNGSPANAEWCNASGRSLGVKPTRDTGNNLIDAFFWVKPPGESDGPCNGGLSAGKFWNEYALELIRNIKH